MKQIILREYSELEEKLAGFVGAMNFRFMNLCVKAEEASLIPIRVNADGIGQNLENVSTIGKKDEYNFMIVPNVDEDMNAIAMGIAAVHPDFIQKVETVNVDAFDTSGNPINQDVAYLLVSMPEVDDERYDLLKQGVDFFYEECKLQMDKAVMQSTSRISMVSIGESAEDIKTISEGIDKLKADKSELRDKLHAEKLKEIEDAHNKWLADNGRSPHGSNGAEGRDVSMSMRLDATDES